MRKRVSRRYSSRWRGLVSARTQGLGKGLEAEGAVRDRWLRCRCWCAVLPVVLVAGVLPPFGGGTAAAQAGDAPGQSTPPAVSTTTPPYIFQSPGTPDHFKRFDQITIQVTFTRAVTVTGTPRIGLDIGGVRRNASYSSGAGDFLLFRYDVGPDDLDADGIDIVANSLELRGGSITGVGEAAVLNHPSQLATDTRRPVDGVAPVATLLSNSSGYEHPDNLVPVTVEFSEPVTGLTADDFTVTNGVAVDLEAEPSGVPGTRYSFQITHGGEGAVTVTLPIGSVHDAAGNGNAASPVLRIIVADPTRVTISPTSSNTVEGQPVTFSLNRSKDNGARTVVVEVSQAGDFLSGSTSFGATISTTPVEVSVDFAAGELTKTLSLDTEDDYQDDADGSVTLTVRPDPTELGYVAGTPDAATASVLDNDEAPNLLITRIPFPPAILEPLNQVQEGRGIKFILVRTHDAGPQTLDVEISQQGNFLAANHPNGLTIPSDGRIEISYPAGILAAEIVLNTRDDTVEEADGRVKLTVLPRPSDSMYPVAVQATSTMTVRDNDGPPTVTITAVAASVTEGSDVAVTVSRTNAPGEHTRRTFVRLLITDPDGALAPGTNLSPFIAILDGQTEHTLALETVNDQVPELDGNVTVRVMSNTSVDAPYVVGTPDSATVEVADDEDPIVSVSADVSTLTEGTDAQFTFSRTGSTKSSLTVGVNITGHYKIMGAATRSLASNRSQRPDTTVTFSPGMSEAVLALSTEADQVNEGDGELRVSIKGSPAYEKDGYGSAVVLVEDDDIPEVTLRWITPALTLQNNVWVGTMLEGEAIDWSVDCSGNTIPPLAALSGRVPFKYKSTMNHPHSLLSQYDFTFQARHPCADDPGADRYLASYRPAGHYSRRFTGPDGGTISFDLLPQSLEVPDGIVTRCFLGDLGGTPEELRFCPKFTLGDVTSARIVVRNRNPTITIEAIDESVNEGEPARFKLTRLWAPDLLNDPDPLADLYTTIDYTVRADGHYVTGLPSGQLEFANTVTEIIVEIPTLDDDLVGADGSVTYEILPGSPETQAGNVGGSYEVYDFLDGITPPGKSSRVATVNILNDDTVQPLSITDGSATEGDPVEFVLTLAGPHELPASVAWFLTRGTAREDKDFVDATGTVVFAVGETRQVILVSTVDDDIKEDAETFTLTLSDPVQIALPGNGATASATGTILDNDRPTVTIASLSGDRVVEGGLIEFEVTRDGTLEEAVRIEVSVTIGERDPVVFRRRFESGIVSSSLAFLTNDDSVVSPDIDYVATVVAYPSRYNIGPPGTATVTLLDNDGVRELTLTREGPQNFSTAGETLSLRYDVTNSGTTVTRTPLTIHDSLLGDITCGTQSLGPGDTQRCYGSYTTTNSNFDTGIVFTSAYASDSVTNSETINFFVTTLDVPYYTLTPDTQRVGEAVGTVTLNINRLGALMTESSISYRAVEGTAVDGSDFLAVEGEVTFMPGEYTKSITVSVVDDSLDENLERFSVVLSPTDDAETIWARSTVDIDDNDQTLYFSIDVTDPEDESSGQAEISVELQRTDGAAATSGRVVTVQYETEPGTALAGEDYRSISGELVFEAGEQQKTLSVPIIDDVTNENTEQFSITFKNPRSGTLPSDQESHEISIVDNDDASTWITLSIDPTEVPEDAGATEITVTAKMNANATAVDTEVSVLVTGDTASEGSDFIAVPEFLLTIPARQVSATATFTFTPVDDAVVEDLLESVMVSGAEVTQSLTVASAGGLFALMIRDDDGREVAIVPTEMALGEGENGTYTVALTSQPTGTVTVTPTLPVGAAISLAFSTLTFKPNNWARPRNVTVIARPDADAAHEHVTISHSVTGADYGSVAAPDVVVTVTDDDTPSTTIELWASSVSVTEGGGDRTIVIVAEFDQAAPEVDTTVRVEVGAGTALPGQDFVAVAAFDVLIAVGSTRGSATITLSPVNDDVDEDDETITITGQVTVDGIPDVFAVPVTGTTVTIVDDDSRGVVVTPTALTMEEGDAQSYTVQLTSAPSLSSLITITVPANADLRVSPLGLFFHRDSWNVAQTVRVTALGDADVLEDTAVLAHTFIGTGSDYDGFAVDDVSVTITEHTSTAISVESVRGAEGSASLDFVVSLDQAISTTATVQYRTVGMAGNNAVTATSGDDYTDASGTLTFAPGETRKTVSVSLMDDALNEAEEYLEFVLESPTNAELPQSTMYTVQGIIEDDDPLPVVSVAGSTADGWSYAVETAGPLSYTVRLSEASAREVQVDYATVDRTPGARNTALQTATASADYVPQNGTLTFLAGETVKSLSVILNDDQISEGDEIFALDLSNPRNAVLSNHGWGVIRDEDVRGLVLTPPTLTLNEDTSSEYYVALTSQPTATVTVSLTASNGVTLDVSSLSFTATSWSTQQKVTVTAADDADAAHGAATITHSFAGGDYQGLSAVEMTVNIRDTDIRSVVVSTDSVTVPEGGSSTYTVVLTSEPSSSVTVTPSRTGSPDVTVSPSPLTFTIGNWFTPQTVTVSADHDLDASNDAARVSHAVSGADYGDETAADVFVTVSDDETASTIVELSVDKEGVDEDAGSSIVTVTATLNEAPRTVNTVVAVTVGDPNDSAMEGTDYETIGNLSLYIVPGTTSGTVSFTLTPTDNHLDEADKALTVDGSVTGLSVTATTVTIHDDDRTGVTVSETALTVTEEDTTGGSYTVVLDSQPAAGVVVTVAGHAGSEVSPNPTTLTFTSTNWSTAQEITVTAAHDVDGSDDTVTLSHSAASSDGDYQGIAIDGVAVTVADNETPSTEVILAVDPEWVSEGDALTSVRLTATLNEAPLSELTLVTVTVGAPGDSAVEGVDYATIGDLTLNIRAGQTSTFQSFQFRPVNTGIGEGDEFLSISGTTMVTSLTVIGTQLVVVDDEVDRSVTLSAVPGSVAEDGGPMTVVVTATLDSLPYSIDSPVTVMVGASLDSATEGTDYTSVDDFTITVAAGSTSATGEFQLTPTNDIFGEGDETISISGRGAGPPAVVQGTEVTITDDETVSTGVVLTVVPATLSEGDGATTVTVTATLNQAPRNVATVLSLSVGGSGDTAAEGTDYATVGSVSLTINANQTAGTATFRLNPTDDDFDEDNEFLTVDGSVAGFSVTAATVTISDDDNAGVTVNPTSLTVAEGDSSSYTVVLTSQPTGAVTVTVSRTGSTDVAMSQSSLTFTPSNWSSAQTVTVTAAQDADASNDAATIRHAVTGADYATVTAASVTVTVTDDETVSTGVVLTVAPVTVSENAAATTVTVTATLNQAPRNVATVLSCECRWQRRHSSRRNRLRNSRQRLVDDQRQPDRRHGNVPAEPDRRQLRRRQRVFDCRRFRRRVLGDSGNSDDQRQRQRRSDSQPDIVDSRRRRQFKLHSGVDVAADRRCDCDSVTNRQYGCGNVTVVVDVHAVELVNSTDSDSDSSAGRRRVERRSNNQTCRHRSGLCNSDSSVGDSDRH